jgi:hypothetical protein
MEIRMRLSTLVCTTLILFCTAAGAAPAPLMHGGLTPEEHFLYMRQQHGLQWRDLSLNERCERKQQMRQERLQMTPAAFHALKQKLDAEWQSMPATEKQRIEQRIAYRQQHHGQGQNRPHQRACAGI